MTDAEAVMAAAILVPMVGYILVQLWGAWWL